MSPLKIEALPGFEAPVRINRETKDDQVRIIDIDGKTRSVNHQESFTLQEGEILVLPDEIKVQVQIGEGLNDIRIIQEPSSLDPEVAKVEVYTKGELGSGPDNGEIPSTLRVHKARARQLAVPTFHTAGDKMRIRVFWEEK
jgi:hypothetical protein